MRRGLRLVAVAVCMTGLLAGCEWTGTGSDGTWDDSYSWVNFSGLYRSPAGGAIVTMFTRTPGSEPSTVVVTGEQIATGVADNSIYGGRVRNIPINSGTLTIVAGGWTFADNGSGGLTGYGTMTGSINYNTGQWAIDLKGALLASGTPIVASYTYRSGGTTGSVDPGSSGTPIYSFNVMQAGNQLTIVDSNGARYEGKMVSVAVAGGDKSGAVGGQVSAEFEVSGVAGNGAQVSIVGSFAGNYTPGESATASAVYTGTLADRVMQGTWIEPGQTADIRGTTGPLTVSVPQTAAVTTDTTTAPTF